MIVLVAIIHHCKSISCYSPKSKIADGGFSGVLIPPILKYSRCCMPIKLSLNSIESDRRSSKEASLPL
jgi:hypothetical protein